jgi:hypothetical protein
MQQLCHVILECQKEKKIRNTSKTVFFNRTGGKKIEQNVDDHKLEQIFSSIPESIH